MNRVDVVLWSYDVCGPFCLFALDWMLVTVNFIKLLLLMNGDKYVMIRKSITSSLFCMLYFDVSVRIFYD